jgi:hypothetical protein
VEFLLSCTDRSLAAVIVADSDLLIAARGPVGSQLFTMIAQKI